MPPVAIERLHQRPRGAQQQRGVGHAGRLPGVARHDHGMRPGVAVRGMCQGPERAGSHPRLVAERDEHPVERRLQGRCGRDPQA
jgi:hypothetical protein